ncbi:MAG: hypothetical protein GX294_07330 [Candidatus Cloacimonetes bacterium]|nr:hypothetical protein [Candidatus Cloacimonadota bacterium]
MMSPPLRERKNHTYEYKAPLRMEDRSTQPNDLSEIITSYVRFYSKLEWDFPKASTLKGNCLRVAVFDGESYSPTVNATYFIFPHFHLDLEVVSVISDPKGLFGFDSGIGVPGRGYFEAGGTTHIYSTINKDNKENFRNRGKYWERDGYVELLDSQNTLYTSQMTGIRIHGFGSRSNPHKALRLYALDERKNRGTFDKDLLNIASEKNTSIQSLILRAGGDRKDYLRDVVAQDIMKDMEIDTQRNKPVIQFINGEYWGIVNLKDRYDEYYIANKYQVDPEDVIVLKEVVRKINGLDRINTNSKDEDHYYNKLHQYVLTHDLSLPQHYQYVCSQIDINSYCDYNITFLYMGNIDWYWYKHFRMWRTKSISSQPFNDGKWRYMVWDFDQAYKHANNLNVDFFNGYINRKHPQIDATKPNSFNGRTDFFSRLAENAEFREHFVKRALWHLDNTFATQRVYKIIDERYSTITSELPRHKERWSIEATSANDVADMKRFAARRSLIFRTQLMKYFPEQFTDN